MSLQYRPVAPEYKAPGEAPIRLTWNNAVPIAATPMEPDRVARKPAQGS